mmetsp:Transcript_37902/g.52627  ORF Transcript_37902/g.52627 Transcript_37902/m.52627 type:complete len:622 (-) Transcript_37902:379-2244(-)|eukprot:CAMPEP_0196572210 /NCGR_PEP_ID=MMETSP1081-20130531/2293_1 /TAXON_ID=36882 /ORGANISM="Pyramimonas amylifera, Strain CCMP720" /LENGTH=621 /DNA_ID=CAMNT_0041889445 /DNA_START=43 /DNA_END=1908 /DNA_ORIENTATION=-
MSTRLRDGLRLFRHQHNTLLNLFRSKNSLTLVSKNSRSLSKYTRTPDENVNKSEKPQDHVTPWCRHVVSGWDLMRSPRYNKGLAFSQEERDHLHLRGLLPPQHITLDQQMERVMTNVRTIENPLDKYTYLMALQERNQRLFFHALHEHVDELLPIYGNPTVGLACQKYGTIFRRPCGIFLSMTDRGHIHSILTNWPEADIKMLVISDGERVLGLGDLGMQAMSVLGSKAAWAVAAGGIHPQECLPVIIDNGTDNPDLLADKFYFGLKHPRIRSEQYDELVDEFVEAAQKKFGNDVQLHFTDFDYVNAGRLLLRHRANASCYNDDLQGMAAVTLAGLLATIGSEELGKQRFMLVGAGEAGISIADLLTYAIARYQKISIPEARGCIWLYDSGGLVVRSRSEHLQYHKLPFVHEHPGADSLIEAIQAVKPTVMIGTSTTSYTKGGTFTRSVCEAMSQVCQGGDPPVIFALSGRFNTPNMADKQECSAQDAYDWTGGNVVFVGGGKEAPVTTLEGKQHDIRKAHTLYIYPGIALGLRLSGSVEVHDEMILAAAEALTQQVTNEDREVGAIYPPLSKIREVSVHVAAAVAAKAYELGCARVLPEPRNLLKAAVNTMYKLDYESYR